MKLQRTLCICNVAACTRVTLMLCKLASTIYCVTMAMAIQLHELRLKISHDDYTFHQPNRIDSVRAHFSIYSTKPSQTLQYNLTHDAQNSIIRTSYNAVTNLLYIWDDPHLIWHPHAQPYASQLQTFVIAIN